MRHYTWVLLLLVGSWSAQPARADTLDTLLAIAAEALGEPWLKDARPMFECIRAHGPANCAGMKLQAEGQAAAKQIMPNDPLVKKVIQFIDAVEDKDWLEVVELGGGAAIQVACKTTLSGGGKLKEFMCKAAGNVSDAALKAVFRVVSHPSVSNLVNAIGAIGDPGVICDLVPGFPGKDGICGPLGSVIAMTKDLVNGAAAAGKDVFDFAAGTAESLTSLPGDALESVCQLVQLCDDDEDSKPKFMSEAAYYKYVLFPKIQGRVMAYLLDMSQTGGEATERVKCLGYYQYYYLSKKSAFAQALDQRCTRLVKRWSDESKVMANTLEAGSAAYYTAAVEPQVPHNVVEDYKSGNAYKFSAFMGAACASNLESQFPMPKGKIKVTTAWDTACAKLRHQAEKAWIAQKAKVDASITELAGQGCVDKGAASPQKLLLRCTTVAGYENCLKALAGGEELTHCAMVGEVTNAALDHSAGGVVQPPLGGRSGQLREAQTETVGRVDPRVVSGASAGRADAATLEITTARTTVTGMCTPSVSITVHATVAHSGTALPARAATLRIVDPARRGAVLATAAIPALSGTRSAEVRATFAPGGGAGDLELAIDIIAASGGADVKLPRLRQLRVPARQFTCTSPREAETRNSATRDPDKRTPSPQREGRP